MSARSMRMMAGAAVLATGALVLSACSPAAEEPSGDSKSLTISWKGSEKAGIDAVVEAFKADNPGIDVTVTTAEASQYQSTLRTQLSAGTATDVIFVWPADGNPAAIRQLAPGGFLEDLSGRSWVAKYPASMTDLTAIDGKTYLMAPAVTSFGPWYNADALAETGLTPPSSWSEVIPFCQAAASQGKTAFAVGAATLVNTQNLLYGLVPDLVYGVDPDHDAHLAAGETTFSDTPGWLTAMNHYKEMLDAGCYNADPTGLPQDEQNRLVATGEALGMFAIGFQLSALTALNPDTDYVLYPFSGDDDPNTNMMTISNAGGAAVFSGAKNKELALQFVDYLAEPKTLAVYTNALVGAVPAITDGFSSDDPNLAIIADYLGKGQGVHFLNQLWPNARIEQAMYAAVQGLMTNAVTPAEVLEAMDAEYR